MTLPPGITPLSLDEVRELLRNATPGPYHLGAVRTFGIYADAYAPNGRRSALATVTHWNGDHHPAEEIDAHNARLLAASNTLAWMVLDLHAQLHAQQAQPGQAAGRDDPGV